MLHEGFGGGLESGEGCFVGGVVGGDGGEIGFCLVD